MASCCARVARRNTAWVLHRHLLRLAADESPSDRLYSSARANWHRPGFSAAQRQTQGNHHQRHTETCSVLRVSLLLDSADPFMSAVSAAQNHVLKISPMKRISKCKRQRLIDVPRGDFGAGTSSTRSIRSPFRSHTAHDAQRRVRRVVSAHFGKDRPHLGCQSVCDAARCRDAGASRLPPPSPTCAVARRLARQRRLGIVGLRLRDG